MYSFAPSAEQEKLIEVTHRYAQDLRAAAHEAEEGGELPAPLIEKGWDLGLLQTSVSEDYGGFGERSVVSSALALEELAWGDLAGALALLAPNLYALPLALAGSEAQKKELLPPILEGGWQPYTAAFIEPVYDFDPLALRTTATKKDKGYTLQGTKSYVPFAAEAPAMLVYAGLGGQTQAFLVKAGQPGITVGERQKLLGLHALPCYEVNFDQVEVEAGARLGGSKGADFGLILASMHTAWAALAVGLGRAAFEYARDYAKEREVFGSKVAQKQSIAFMLAEMATEIDATRLLTWQAAWQLDQGQEEAAHTAYLAASGAADMAMMVTDRAVQILGGHGYIREHPVELWMRNGRGIANLNSLAII